MSNSDNLSDTPLQSAMRSVLRLGEAVPAPDLAIRDELAALILERVGDAAPAILARPLGSPVIIDRVGLADVHACEAFFVDGSTEPFRYDIRKARGQIAFTTIRRWYYRDARTASEEVDIEAAVQTTIDDTAQESGSLGEYLSGMSSGERGQLVAEASNVTYAFLEAWPVGLTPRPLRTHWRLKTSLLSGRLELSYRVSFRFGQPYRDPTQGLMSAAVLLDVRPGRQYEEEERANRFYASLIEALSVRVPPVRAATWYAESQDVYVDEIDIGSLKAAARRVGDGVRRMMELHNDGRRPDREAGWRCDYCRMLESCLKGQTHRSRFRSGETR